MGSIDYADLLCSKQYRRSLLGKELLPILSSCVAVALTSPCFLLYRDRGPAQLETLGKDHSFQPSQV